MALKKNPDQSPPSPRRNSFESLENLIKEENQRAPEEIQPDTQSMEVSDPTPQGNLVTGEAVDQGKLEEETGSEELEEEEGEIDAVVASKKNLHKEGKPIKKPKNGLLLRVWFKAHIPH